jgi:hypothetical protein
MKESVKIHLEDYSKLLTKLGRQKEAEEMSLEAFGLKMGLMD